jgi:hypothetical protein
MRLHTDDLHPLLLRKAATLAGVTFTKFEQRGSRSRERAFDVILSGSSSRNQNMGGQDKAATWDEWGIFLATLYTVDPAMTAGQNYECADHFHWVTGDRYRTLTLAEQHANHKWEFSGETATGAYMVHECGKCGAIRRFLHHQTWAEFVAQHA